MIAAAEAGMCGARSKPGVPDEPESYFICTNDAGHNGRHSACDGQGHVLARWRSETSPVEAWIAGGVVWR